MHTRNNTHMHAHTHTQTQMLANACPHTHMHEHIHTQTALRQQQAPQIVHQDSETCCPLVCSALSGGLWQWCETGEEGVFQEHHQSTRTLTSGYRLLLLLIQSDTTYSHPDQRISGRKRFWLPSMCFVRPHSPFILPAPRFTWHRHCRQCDLIRSQHLSLARNPKRPVTINSMQKPALNP